LLYLFEMRGQWHRILNLFTTTKHNAITIRFIIISNELQYPPLTSTGPSRHNGDEHPLHLTITIIIIRLTLDNKKQNQQK